MDDDVTNDELAPIKPSNDQLAAIDGLNTTINADTNANDAEYDVT